MYNNERILGLFYSDKDNLIFDKIKFSEDLSEENKNNLDMVSYKFLGPIFLTTASNNEENWKIELIESSLSHYALQPGVMGNTRGSAPFSDWSAFNLMQVSSKVNRLSPADIAADTKAINRSPTLNIVSNPLRTQAPTNKNLHLFEAG